MSKELTVNQFKALYELAVDRMLQSVAKKNKETKRYAQEELGYDKGTEEYEQYVSAHKAQSNPALIRKFVLVKAKEAGLTGLTENNFDKWLKKAGYAKKDTSSTRNLSVGSKIKQYDGEAQYFPHAKWHSQDTITMPDGSVQAKYAIVQRTGSKPKKFILERDVSNPDKPKIIVYDTINPHASTEEWKNTSIKDKKILMEEMPYQYIQKHHKVGEFPGLMEEKSKAENDILQAIAMDNPMYKKKSAEEWDRTHRFSSLIGKKVEDIAEKNHWDKDKLLWFIQDMGGVVKKDGTVERFPALVREEDRMPFPERHQTEIEYNGETLHPAQEALDKNKAITLESAERRNKANERIDKKTSYKTVQGKGGSSVKYKTDKSTGESKALGQKKGTTVKKTVAPVKDPYINEAAPMDPNSETDSVAAISGFTVPEEQDNSKVDRQLYGTYGNKANVETPAKKESSGGGVSIDKIAALLASLTPGQLEQLKEMGAL